MASELFVFENSFFSDPFSSTIDVDDDNNNIFQTIENNFINNQTIQDDHHEADEEDDDAISLEHIASVLLSSSSSPSPPSHQLENLSLYPTTGFHSGSCSGNVPFGNVYGYSNLDMTYNEMKLMQRSYSSNCFGNNKDEFLFQPCFDSFVESPNLQNHVVNSPENSYCYSQMRKVCSTGDLHKMKVSPLSSSPLCAEKSFIEDAANVKVGRYSAEERKERIDRYRAKRTQRNFNKTIKYACRKTLADHRPRIRGRFARNDEAGEIPKTTTSNTYSFQNGEDIWINGVREEDEERSYYNKRASIYNTFNSTQYEYHSY